MISEASTLWLDTDFHPVESSTDLKKPHLPKGFLLAWPVDGALDGPRNGKGKEYILHLKG